QSDLRGPRRQSYSVGSAAIKARSGRRVVGAGDVAHRHGWLLGLPGNCDAAAVALKMTCGVVPACIVPLEVRALRRRPRSLVLRVALSPGPGRLRPLLT